MFDQKSWELYLNAELMLSERWLLGAGLRYRDGDLNSTADAFNSIVLAAEAITQDTAVRNNTFAYRLDAQTLSFSIGLDYALSDYSSLNLGYEYQAIDAAAGIDYDKKQVRLRYLYSF